MTRGTIRRFGRRLIIARGMMAGAALAMSATCLFAEPVYHNVYASTVVEYTPGPGNAGFANPALALGGPTGRYDEQYGYVIGSTDVATLGGARPADAGASRLGWPSPTDRGRILSCARTRSDRRSPSSVNWCAWQ